MVQVQEEELFALCSGSFHLACHLHQLSGRLVCNRSQQRGGPLGGFATPQGPSGVREHFL